MSDFANLEGEWTVTVKAPTGARGSSLVLKVVDGALSGVQSGEDGNPDEIDSITFDASNGEIEWTNQIQKPMKLKLEFKGVVEGNSRSGKVKTGFMGTFPFTGEKV